MISISTSLPLFPRLRIHRSQRILFFRRGRRAHRFIIFRSSRSRFLRGARSPLAVHTAAFSIHPYFHISISTVSSLAPPSQVTRANTEAGPFSASCEKGKGYNFVLTTILVHIPVSQSRGITLTCSDYLALFGAAGNPADASIACLSQLLSM